MNNLTAGGIDPRNGQPWAYYETSGGGLGGGPEGAGLDAAHSHMTNTLNTPAEALEFAYPLRVVENSIRPRSGGAGQHRGGHGLIRRTQFLGSAQLTLITERRTQQPWGSQGGESGRTGRNSLETTSASGRPLRRKLPGKITINVEPGDIVRVETPAGADGAIPLQAEWDAKLGTTGSGGTTRRIMSDGSDRLERDVEEVLSNIEDFDWRKRQSRRPGPIRIAAQRFASAVVNRITALAPNHLLILGALMLIVGLSCAAAGCGSRLRASSSS